MVSRDRLPMDPNTARDVVKVLERHRAELLPFYTWLPRKAPSRAALKTLLDQQAEIVGIVTGDRDYFKGKAHSASFK